MNRFQRVVWAIADALEKTTAEQEQSLILWVLLVLAIVALVHFW